MQAGKDMTAASSMESHPIFSFADGEMGPIANSFIRAMEKVTGQPKIKKSILIMWMMSAHVSCSGQMR
jgi:hypothetical protein